MKNFFSILIYISLFSLMACVNDSKSGSDVPSAAPEQVSSPVVTETPAQVQQVEAPSVEKPVSKPQTSQRVQQTTVQSNAPAAPKAAPASKPALQQDLQEPASPPNGQNMTGKDLSPKTRQIVMNKTGLTEAEISNMGPMEIERAMQAYQMKMQKEAEANPRVPKKVEPPKNQNTLPSTCGLVSTEFIGKTIGVPADPIDVKDGSAKNVSHQRACFFKWPYNNVPNSGVMVQLNSNPVPDELPDWASYYISTKKNNGDKAPDGSATYRYKDFPDMGVDGAYNYELGRYYFRTDQDHVVGILFNLQASDAEQLLWATKIGKEVLKNLY